MSTFQKVRALLGPVLCVVLLSFLLVFVALPNIRGKSAGEVSWQVQEISQLIPFDSGTYAKVNLSRNEITVLTVNEDSSGLLPVTFSMRNTSVVKSADAQPTVVSEESKLPGFAAMLYNSAERQVITIPTDGITFVGDNSQVEGYAH